VLILLGQRAALEIKARTDLEDHVDNRFESGKLILALGDGRFGRFDTWTSWSLLGILQVSRYHQKESGDIP
jgi:hypothetical protein